MAYPANQPSGAMPARPLHRTPLPPLIPPISCLRAVLVCWTSVLLLSWGWQVEAADSAAEREHQAALAEVKAGQLEAALGRLARLAREHPRDNAYLHDLIAVLQRAKRNDDALAQLRRVDRASAPAYVLEALAAAAVATRRFDLAEELLLQSLSRYPGRPESLNAMADALTERIFADANLPADRSARLSGLRAADQIAIMSGTADRLEAKSNLYPALHLNQVVLQRAPEHQPAQAAVVRLTARLGAAHLALQLAQRYPQAASAGQVDTLERHRVAVDGRWAQMLRTLPRRHRHGQAQLDAALAMSDDLSRRFVQSGAVLSEAELKWLHDRIVFLSARQRARDAVQLYDTFNARSLLLPNYVLGAVADALVALRQPKRPLPLYDRVLGESPNDAAAQVGKYYALLESESHGRSYDWIDAWARTAVAIYKAQPTDTTQAQQWDARVLRARARDYSGEHAVAQRELDQLREAAPANGSVRAALASVYRSRGWPRLAWESWQIHQLHDPEDVDAYAESVAPLLDVWRFEDALEQLRLARRHNAEASAVTRATRAWTLHNRPELVLQTGSGRSSDVASPVGSKDYSADLHVYSPPFGERYRAFAHGHYVQGDVFGDRARHRRVGAGLEYRGDGLRLTGEYHLGIKRDGGGGARLGAQWSINDVWQISVEGDAKTTDLPLQARAADIHASRAQLSVEARVHEWRAFSASALQWNFSDDNRRQAVQLAWREGLWVRPRYWLSGRVDLYASRNSHDNAAYFNPKSDRSASLSLTGAWRTYRWYERDFVQELTLSAGGYWQERFGADPIRGVEYAHRWNLDERLYLRYGWGRTLRYYDGQESGRAYLTLDLDWRF